MSIVRYTNKTTGVVTLYESTSHYDPETKQSRPVRKYLGREDPETGELIPSTGRRGRKAGTGSKTTDADAVIATMRTEINDLKKELAKKDKQIAALEQSNSDLLDALKGINEAAAAAIKSARNH